MVIKNMSHSQNKDSGSNSGLPQLLTKTNTYEGWKDRKELRYNKGYLTKQEERLLDIESMPEY